MQEKKSILEMTLHEQCKLINCPHMSTCELLKPNAAKNRKHWNGKTQYTKSDWACKYDIGELLYKVLTEDSKMKK